jgi:hypothetical protein
MQLRHFVSGSAVILAGWLAVTFIHEVPTQRYPRLDKDPAVSIAPRKTADASTVADKESPVAHVSRSR